MIEPATDLESQLTNFVRMSYFFVEPMINQDAPPNPETVLGVVADLQLHINKYSLILKRAGYNIDTQLTMEV
jgi:hypothetical protein